MDETLLEAQYEESEVPEYVLPPLIGREETLALFRKYVYGGFPNERPEMEVSIVEKAAGVLGGRAVRQQVKVTLRRDGVFAEFGLLIYTPQGAIGGVPIFLGLNFTGNHAANPDPEILLSKAWMENSEKFGVTENRASELGRGRQAWRWPVDLLLAHGYGMATVYYGDLAPDSPEHVEEGVLKFFEPSECRGGAIAAWAWGLSRALDALEQIPEVDARRVAVVGHSRQGKAALWAGANDERFSLVISNNSGCGGAALSRRRIGERFVQINQRYPHWFTGKFHEYDEREADLPVDQHQLLALMAGRALYVASAVEDRWADPYGEYLSLVAAAPAWGMEWPKESPLVEEPLLSGKLGYHIRSGKHDITEYDWRQFVKMADGVWQKPR